MPPICKGTASSEEISLLTNVGHKNMGKAARQASDSIHAQKLLMGSGLSNALKLPAWSSRPRAGPGTDQKAGLC